MINMYEISIPPVLRALNNLSHILQKGEAHANENGIEASIFINARLFPDMYPLTRQVQIATDMAKGAAARLAGLEVPKYEDNETSFAELQTRIANTIAFMQSVNAAQLVNAESREIELLIRKHKVTFTGLDYLLNWVKPNVYFHVSTAYDILRHNGVVLGKPDYLGNIGGQR